MASPVVEGTATTGGTGPTANAVVNLPATIQAGETLIVLHRSAVGTAAHGYPGG